MIPKSIPTAPGCSVVTAAHRSHGWSGCKPRFVAVSDRVFYFKHSANHVQHHDSALHACGQAVFPLAAACSEYRAAIGMGPQGCRGLFATCDVAPGDIVLSLPLHNMLQVPRALVHPEMLKIASTAWEAWQRQHWQLPGLLLSFLGSSHALWEAKLVAWLLYLRAAAPDSTLWHSYFQSLPSLAETITFCCYSEQQIEQLQFSTWKKLATKQRVLLQSVQQQCQAAGLEQLFAVTTASSSGGSSSSSTGKHQPTTLQDYAWALSMVKSRTFGQQWEASLFRQSPGQRTTADGGCSPTPTSSPQKIPIAAAAGADSRAAAEASAASQAPTPLMPVAKELEDGDASVFLLMAPFVDMVNHSFNHNCTFGIDLGSQSFHVRCCTAKGLKAGQEVTISYGSNKTNLALLSCYGFQVPGNPNDAQLVEPIFQACLGMADESGAFSYKLLQQASKRLAAQQQLRQQQDLGARSCETSALILEHMLHPDVVAARQACALSCLPVNSQQEHLDAQGKYQQQQHLVQLMLYQVNLIFKRLGTSVDNDLGQLAQLSQVLAAAGNGGSVDDAIQQQAVAARLEHKLLLKSCEQLLQQLAQLQSQV